MTEQRKERIALVGAGIGGATAALALARRGQDVIVLEQAPAFKPLYKGEYLQPRSLEIFTELGLGEATRAVTHPVYFSTITLGGQTISELDMRTFCPYEGRNGHHREIQGVVLKALSALPNAELHMGARLTGLHREGGQWRLETTAGSFAASFVVGADGRMSRVRELLGIAADQYQYPGPSLGVTVNLATEADSRFVHAFGTDDSGYCFPLPGRQTRLYLLMHTEEAYEALKADPDGGVARFQERLAAFFPHLREAISAVASMKEVQVIHAHYLMAERWVTDGAALLGDAAHCVNPVRGQGMNLAIADAWELASLLAESIGTGRTDAQTLRPYEQRRRPAAAYVQADGERARWLFLHKNPLVVGMRNRMMANFQRAPRAARRFMATMTGMKAPPSGLEGAAMMAAFAFPALDRLVPPA